MTFFKNHKLPIIISLFVVCLIVAVLVIVINKSSKGSEKVKLGFDSDEGYFVNSYGIVFTEDQYNYLRYKDEAKTIDWVDEDTLLSLNYNMLTTAFYGVEAMDVFGELKVLTGKGYEKCDIDKSALIHNYVMLNNTLMTGYPNTMCIEELPEGTKYIGDVTKTVGEASKLVTDFDATILESGTKLYQDAKDSNRFYAKNSEGNYYTYFPITYLTKYNILFK